MSFFTYLLGGGGAFPNLPSRKFYALIRGGYHVIPWKGEGVSPFDINPSGGFSFWCHLIEGGIPSWFEPFWGFPVLTSLWTEKHNLAFLCTPERGWLPAPTPSIPNDITMNSTPSLTSLTCTTCLHHPKVLPLFSTSHHHGFTVVSPFLELLFVAILKKLIRWNPIYY